MKILFVARHFPPAVSGGAARPYLLAREFQALGHDVTVIAPSSIADIPVIVVPHRHVDPDLSAPRPPAGFRAWLRNWMLPDPDIRWAIAASRAAGIAAPDWVVTTSPPESSHVAGWLLKRRYRCRWLADFRDHWFQDTLHAARRKNGLRFRIEHFLARRMLRNIDLAMATTASIASEVGQLASRNSAILFEHIAEAPSDEFEFEEGPVHIVHTGSFILSDPGRDIRPLIEAFVASRNSRLRLHLVGRLRADEVALIENAAVSAQIELHGIVDHATARSMQSAADVLLLVTAPDTPHVPGKLAEYRAARKPVLALGGGAWREAAGIKVAVDPVAAFSALPDSLPAIPAKPQSPRQMALQLLDSMLQTKSN